MKEIIISPPFGAYVRHKDATSVLGSYTWKRRPGRLLKSLQFIYDNLVHPVEGGWRNRIGLRNPGIVSLSALSDKFIYSIVGLEPDEWECIYYLLLEKSHSRPVHLEINLGCGNVHEYEIDKAVLRRYCDAFVVTAKLPAGPHGDRVAGMCVDAGVGFLHVGNTLPGPTGSISGLPLQHVNLGAVERLARTYSVPIIGGGGIYSYDDLLAYRRAGASHFSLCTVWFRPRQALRIISQNAAGK